MAKATEKDMEAALAMCRALESLESGYLPDEMTEGQEEPVWYDETKHAAEVVEFMIGIQRRASLFRVCFGMTVLLDSENGIVDQELSHLELHPRLRACKSACEGIDTEVLEVTHGLDAIYSDIQRRRDLLLAAMKKLSGMKLNMIADGIVDKAIAEAEASA